MTKAIILGFGVYFEEVVFNKFINKSPRLMNGWIRTGSRVVHGIRTYPTLDEATAAILSDPHLGKRVGRYQIVAEYAFFCQRGENCPECLSHEPVTDIDWTVVQEKAVCSSS